MKLTVQNIGKHYHKKWLFKAIDFELNTGESIAIKGRNGSGKSTLMQIIYGLVNQNEGHVLIDNTSLFIPSDYFAISAPYLELPTEFSLAEVVRFHLQLGKLNTSVEEFADNAEFTQTQSNQVIKYFSSGMQQRLKTALCLCSTHPIKLLDEPLTNMDNHGEKWYHHLLSKIASKHIVIIAGNAENERLDGMKSIEI